MSDLIETNAINGFKVYGQQMVEYTVAGNSGVDFGYAIAFASLEEAMAIEVETNAYSAVLRTRQKKLSELSDALAILTQALATMKSSGTQQSTDKSSAMDSLYTAREILNKYGVYNLTLVDGNKVERGTAQKAQAQTEYEMDMENNDLQQDMITVQGLISKRDDSYSTAAKVLKKVNSTGNSIINSLGN